ncbi:MULTISPECIES: IclR family transcriptional regulator [unclassified Streptomyces]|uniref:IclR family transcriptional regulator n=1 Tax=unclassified Streptomyces TaxID=2593676 RepID=UPI0022542DEA|nr:MULTISPECIES: IclR family transcriptional regulator [unclassified Streptomyces]MCX4409933.1 IclR family transcriptional regulator [Streptomyces sp. NBC_01764]MCX5191703.1 IclR family transcriptional regulator [Streptomyces sp. NBC_00268]
MRTQHGESVLARVVRIFEAFTPEESALTVSEISRRTGLHVATGSRLVAELVSYGFLTREADRRVRVGMRMWELATRASPTLSLRDAAMPFMEGVHDVVGHHVQLGVLDGDEVLFLERLTAPGGVINYTRIAGRLPLHASSSGLLLLAHGPAELRRRVLDAPLQRYTPDTPATPARLRAVLADVRLQGYAYCPGYVHPDALGIAAPVRDAHGEVVAALAVIVPNEAGAMSVVPVVRTAARGVSRALGAPDAPTHPRSPGGSRYGSATAG